jgi:ABC-type transporter Mla maintaining outer membrane lipid asymmetry permease subunit MlaE
LICFLVGAILAFIGAVQLGKFGAQIYVADLVALEMGAMMTAIIMAGRTGAAFAAQLGTMTVNEEIDALTTLGLSPKSANCRFRSSSVSSWRRLRVSIPSCTARRSRTLLAV